MDQLSVIQTKAKVFLIQTQSDSLVSCDEVLHFLICIQESADHHEDHRNEITLQSFSLFLFQSTIVIKTEEKQRN